MLVYYINVVKIIYIKEGNLKPYTYLNSIWLSTTRLDKEQNIQLTKRHNCDYVSSSSKYSALQMHILSNVCCTLFTYDIGACLNN